MNPNINIRDYLHEVLANKAKTKLTLQQFDSLLDIADQIQKLSEKGLLIVTLAEQLHKISNVNYVTIKKFMNEFLTGLKPQKPRKEHQGGRQRRRRSRPTDSTNVARSLDQIAEESISHPSNLQAGRLGAQTHSSQEEQVSKISQNLSKKSQQLQKQQQKDFQYAHQLNKISEGIQYMPDMGGYQQFREQQIEQYSKSTSSQSYGIVSNFSEKMDLLKPKQGQVSKRQRTARRPGGQATVTKKKAQGFIIDQNLTLQKTKATLNQSIYTEDKSLSYEYSPSLEQYHEKHNAYQNAFEDFTTKIKQKPLGSFENFLFSLKKIDQLDYQQEIQPEFTQIDAGFIGETGYDFTSQLIPEYAEQVPTTFAVSELSIFRYEEANPTIQQVSHKVNKPQSIVFFEMLLKMQKGEVKITQENPSQFSQIRFELIHAE